jgi:DNA polymerase III epsilon subunit-like protein
MSLDYPLLCAIDIETTGPNILKHGIISIGYCIGNILGNVILKKRINLSLDDNMCYYPETEKFWQKHFVILDLLKNNQKLPKDGIAEFITDIDLYDSQYKLIIISDNITFDLGFLNYYLAKYLDRLPLTYRLGKDFRPVYDIDSYARGILRKSYESIWTLDSDLEKKFKFKIKRNEVLIHTPDNDAEYLYNIHRMTLINKNLRSTF